MGENVTTRGIDLLGLPAGARLRIGDQALVEVTGVRNPCRQPGKVRPGDPIRVELPGGPRRPLAPV